MDRRNAGHVVAVRVGDEHKRRATRRRSSNRIEMGLMADTSINEHWSALANQVRPVPSASHRARIGGMQEFRIHSARRSPKKDTEKAKSINAAAVRYGVVMP